MCSPASLPANACSGEHRRPILFWGIVVHFGGSNHSTILLARRLRDHNPVMMVDAYGNCRPYLAALAAARLDTHVLSPHPERGVIGGRGRLDRLLRLTAALPEMAELVWRFGRLVRRIQPRAVVVNSLKALFVARYALPGGMPIVYFLRGDCGRQSWYARRWLRKVDLLLAVSQASLASAAACQPARSGVVYNGVDLAEVESCAAAPEPALPGGDASLRLVFPASLIPLKGQDIAVQAVARLRQAGWRVQLWLAGDKPRGAGSGFPARLLQMVERERLEDYVHFIGWHDNICPVIRASDVAILTSRTEGMPRSLMEAMALAKPVIATRVGGIPELVRDGIDGLLVERDDVEATSAAIAKLMDADLRALMGAAGRERIKTNFTLERQAEEFLRHLDSVC